MRLTVSLFVTIALAAASGAETAQQRGKRVVEEALQAVGGPAFLAMEDRVETGRAYSFYREKLEGLSIARIYTRYVTAAPGELGVRERQNFGKDEYAQRNHQEFFAVTASIFLAGKESIHEPHTRAKLKEKLPKYYKYLVELFGFDPDGVTPVASTASPPPASDDAVSHGGT